MILNSKVLNRKPFLTNPFKMSESIDSESQLQNDNLTKQSQSVGILTMNEDQRIANLLAMVQEQ